MLKKPLPERVRTFHKAYGRLDTERCGGCAHFRRYKQAATWFKCALARQSGSTATDWRVNWPACGKFEQRRGEITTIRCG
jgi:hypothetical protein